ncbi:MAG: copper-binding protein [Betaproteobacteria bacterium]
MKVIAVVTVAALIIPAGAALAQAGSAKSADAKSTPENKADSATHKATGVVKKVDPAEGKVILAHDPVKELKWPAMTMGFAVKDKALFKKLVVDQKIEFEFVQQGSTFIVTAVK